MVIGVNGPFHTSFPLIKPDVSLNISSSAWLWEERMGVLECPHRDHCNEPSTTVPDSRQLERLCSPLGAVGWGRRLEPARERRFMVVWSFHTRVHMCRVSWASTC